MDAVLSLGGIAQLGERLLCKQGVSGSIPLASTTSVRFKVLSHSHRSGGGRASAEPGNRLGEACRVKNWVK